MQTPLQEIYNTTGKPDYLRWPCTYTLSIKGSWEQSQRETGRSRLLRGRPERGVIYIPEHRFLVVDVGRVDWSFVL